MPICYLDRDGVINHHLPYVGSLDRFVWFEEIIKIALKIDKYNYKFIVITNQSGIARGYYTLDDFLGLNKIIISRFKENGIDIEIRFCPHLPEDKCNCRKPNTGMTAMDNRSDKDIFIGDQISDMECALNSGINNRWLINARLRSKYETRRAKNHHFLLKNFDYWYSNDIGLSKT